MMNWQALKAEITKPEYAGATDAEIAATLNAKTITTPRTIVPLWEVKKAAIESFAWPSIMAAQASQTTEVAATALLAVAFIDDQRFENIDFSLQSTQAMLAVLSAGENPVITADQLSAINALTAGTTQTWAEANGCTRYGPLTAAHIERARAS